MNIEELVNYLNGLKILQTEIDFRECLSDEILVAYFTKCVKSDLHIDKHRHYETSITVYEYENDYFGVESITDIFSESSTVEDCYHRLRFMRMKQVQIITYDKL